MIRLLYNKRQYLLKTILFVRNSNRYGVSIKYINGYPDYKGAKAVVQEVDIGGFISRGVDRRKADRLAPNGSRQRGNVWHHSQDGHTMQEIDGELHRRFTHKGGFTLRKRKE